MKGIIYRLGVSVKDAGERLGCRKLKSIGLMIQSTISNCSIGGL